MKKTYNLAKLAAAIDRHEPATILEAIGLATLRDMMRLPVMFDGELEDAEDYIDMALNPMNWADPDQQRRAYRDCEALMGFLDGYKLAGDGRDLGTRIVPMPQRCGPEMEDL